MIGKRRRFRRRPRRIWLLLVLIAGLGLSRWGHDRWRGVPQPAREPPLAEGDYTVVRVVDGDTLLVAPQSSPPARSRREIRLRLLGIDCPESVKPDHPVEPWAREAAEFTRQFVSGGSVRLRFDKRRLDRYDRYLAYVFVADKMLNEELLRAGLARCFGLSRRFGIHGAASAGGRRRGEGRSRRGVWVRRGSQCD